MAQKPRCHKCGAIVRKVADDFCRQCGAKLRKTIRIPENLITTIEEALAQRNKPEPE